MLSKKLVADNVKLVDELITYTDEKIQEPKKQTELKELLQNIKKFLLQQKKKLILKIIWRNCRLLMRWMLTVYLKLWQPVIRGHFRHLLLII